MEVAEKLINFRVYNSPDGGGAGSVLMGMADIDLPDLESLTETISGAGIAGEIDSPVLGHFKSMSLKIKWRTMSDTVTELAVQKAHNLDCRGSIQEFSGLTGKYKNFPVKVIFKAIPKKMGLGKLEMGKPMDNESEFECIYMKLWISGKEKIEIDKYNYIAKFNSKDYLEGVRKDLGIG